MLHYKIERAIFITLFIICFFVAGSYATGLKYYVLPINKELTPEQVIEQEFPQLKYNNRDYYYKIIDDFLFVCMEAENGYSRLEFAYRNPNSGFMFELPGLKFGGNYIIETRMVDFADTLIFYHVYKFNDGYVIELFNMFKSDISVYLNDTRLIPFTFNDSRNEYWVTVVSNLDDLGEIYCYYNDQKIHILNADEIEALFEEDNT